MGVEKIEAFWKDATADDVAQMMKGEKLNARFRDHLQEDWSKTVWLLAGYDSTEENSWIDNTGCPWRYCQVYREPSWHANKPDPGPGWRLLKKMPDEELKPGDEYFDKATGRWHLSGHAKTQKQQPAETWYRRHIQVVEPEPRPILTDWQCREGDTYRHPNGLRLKVTEQGFEVTQ